MWPSLFQIFSRRERRKNKRYCRGNELAKTERKGGVSGAEPDRQWRHRTAPNRDLAGRPILDSRFLCRLVSSHHILSIFTTNVLSLNYVQGPFLYTWECIPDCWRGDAACLCEINTPPDLPRRLYRAYPHRQTRVASLLLHMLLTAHAIFLLTQRAGPHFPSRNTAVAA